MPSCYDWAVFLNCGVRVKKGDRVIDHQGRSGVIVFIDEECPIEERILVDFGGLYRERMRRGQLMRTEEPDTEVFLAGIAGIIIISIGVLIGGFAMFGFGQWVLMVFR